MASEFTHLHLHSQYSLLDGAIRLADLFPTIKKYGMDTVALTDHGNMYGVIDFYKRAKEHGVKPIFGSETYICDNRFDKTDANKDGQVNAEERKAMHEQMRAKRHEMKQDRSAT